MLTPLGLRPPSVSKTAPQKNELVPFLAHIIDKPTQKRGSAVKMPVENFAEIWYHNTILSLFIEEITNEQEK